MNKMKKSIVSIALMLLMLVSVVGCAPAATPTATPSPAESGSAEPQGWKPEKSVEIVVPYGAGGSSDLLGRAVEAVWSKYCDQPVVITDMPGGGGVTGSLYVSAAKPDGYTLGLAYGSGCDMSMPYLQEMDYDPFKALDPIALLSVHTVMFATLASSEFNTLAEVVEWSNSNGKPITISSSTANGTVDLAFQAFSYYTKANCNIVPHDGTAGSITDLLSGTYMIGGGHPSDVLPFVQSGQLKLLGVAADERDPAMPDVPTLKEQGMDFSMPGSIKGVSAPKGMPDEIKAYYEDLFSKICADEEFKTTMLNMGQPVMYKNTADFTQYFADSNAYYKQMIEDLGLSFKK